VRRAALAIACALLAACDPDPKHVDVLNRYGCPAGTALAPAAPAGAVPAGQGLLLVEAPPGAPFEVDAERGEGEGRTTRLGPLPARAALPPGDETVTLSVRRPFGPFLGGVAQNQFRVPVRPGLVTTVRPACSD
jgi:hypothetical protein